MSTRHSEAATRAAKAICLLHVPDADRKTRGQIASIIDQSIIASSSYPTEPLPPLLEAPQAYRDEAIERDMRVSSTLLDPPEV